MAQAREWLVRVQDALEAAGEAQAAYQRAADPVVRFFDLLTAALTSGDAHLAEATTGAAPTTDPARWGWRDRMARMGQTVEETWDPQGKRIGWVEGKNVYLEPEAAFSVVEQLTAKQGTSLGVSIQTLWKRLSEKGLLQSTDDARHTKRVQIQGNRRRILHLAVALLFPTSGPCGPSGPEAAETHGEGSTDQERPNSWPTHDPEWARNLATTGPENAGESARASNGPHGPHGPVTEQESEPAEEADSEQLVLAVTEDGIL